MKPVQKAAQELTNIMIDLVGEEKTEEVMQLLIERMKKHPQSIKPKLQNFKLYANLL